MDVKYLGRECSEPKEATAETLRWKPDWCVQRTEIGPVLGERVGADEGHFPKYLVEHGRI